MPPYHPWPVLSKCEHTESSKVNCLPLSLWVTPSSCQTFPRPSVKRVILFFPFSFWLQLQRLFAFAQKHQLVVGFTAMFISPIHKMLIRRDTPWSWRWWGTCRRSSIGERVHEWICAASLCVSLCVRLWFVTLLPGVRRNRNISLWSNNPRLKHNTAVAFVLFILFIYFVCPREREPLSVRAIKCKSNDMIMDLPFCCQVGPLRHYTRPLVRCICNFLLHCCFSSLLQAANNCPKTVLKMHGCAYAPVDRKWCVLWPFWKCSSCSALWNIPV